MSSNPVAPAGLTGADHTRLPLLWICGASGAGKSVTAWELYQSHATDQIAYVDIDELMIFGPHCDDTFALALGNLGRLAEIHRDLGTRALIVSGVMESDQLPAAEARLAEVAELTWCPVDADDDTLRHRIRARGWAEDLVGRVIAEAQEWRRTLPMAMEINSARMTREDAVEAADALLTLRPAAAPSLTPILDPDTVGDLLVLSGPRAVGKSTISWGLIMDSIGRGESTGYLEADQLGFLHADTGLREELVHRAVVALATEFSGAGAVRTIVSGTLSPALLSALDGPGSTLVHLDAPESVLVERIAARHDGSRGRLAGDDLEGATPEVREEVLATALRQREEFAGSARIAHTLDVSDPDPQEHVRALRVLVDRSGVRDLGTPPRGGIDHGACCVIITGAPASGKSTLTRRLAEHLERSAWLNGDQIHWIVVGGRVWSLGEPKDEADRQTRLGNQNLISLAKNCAAAGFTPVIDWIIPDGQQLEQFVEGLAPLSLWLICLDPGDEVCRQRDAQREHGFAFDGYAQLLGGMKEAFGCSAWWIDSSGQSAEETFQLIAHRAGLDAATSDQGSLSPS